MPTAELRERLERDYSVAGQFFSAYSTLESVDRALNSAPLERCVVKSMEWLRASSGIIVATLLRSPDRAELEGIYSMKMRKFSRGFYFDRFSALTLDLRQMDASR